MTLAGLMRATQGCALLGLALGVALARPPAADAGGDDCGFCFGKYGCRFPLPNILLLVEYGSAMNTPVAGGTGQTRWEATVDSVVDVVTMQNGFFDENMRLGLARYGHDPDPSTPDTTIPGDATGLVDGVVLDVGWDDPDDLHYCECNGQHIVNEITALPPPCDGGTCSPVGTWTRGALEFARDLTVQTRADHPDDAFLERAYRVILFTQGRWTSADGTQELGPVDDDPVPAAAELLAQHDVSTWVVTYGDPADVALADALADAGGTTRAAPGLDDMAFQLELERFVNDIRDAVVIPKCSEHLPRVMVILDASSAMLNVGAMAGTEGATPWDAVRGLFPANPNDDFLHMPINNGMNHLGDLLHIGLIVYGDDTVPEEKLVTQYGFCRSDNIAWALDPWSSCEAPGCTDPWGGPTIDWTFRDGSIDPLLFLEPTLSHMPRCEGPGPACEGSAAALLRGLELAEDNRLTYLDAPPWGVEPSTLFINLLVTGDTWVGDDADVHTVLEDAHADGVVTFVLGVGEDVDDPATRQRLDALADAGSDGMHGAFDLATLDDLEAELIALLDTVYFDPCCEFNDCVAEPEPPLPTTDTGTTSTSAGDTSTGSTSTDTGSSTSDTTTTASSSGTITDTTSGGGVGSGTTTSSSAPDDGGPSDTGGGDDGGAPADNDVDDTDSGAAGRAIATRGCACTARAGAPVGLTTLMLPLLLRRRRRSRNKSRTV